MHVHLLFDFLGVFVNDRRCLLPFEWVTVFFLPKCFV